ncbi:MAG TPA: imidazole glycerol phosphate synthase subunit HisH [Gemmatimonadaceae bacterium]|nr:imidazole glycerol phosphate synthase subunit HisH [Gemmatimonadaceae bacterium]
MNGKTIITVFDYGAGNMHSLLKALDIGGDVEVRLQTDPEAALETDALVLPGVGAFSNAAGRLASGAPAMRDAILGGLPTLCICLGMQLLFDDSEEGPGTGLGVIPGHVRRLRAKRIPQIGWNEVESLDEALPQVAYFANSYVCAPDDDDCITAYTTHERDRFASVVTVANTVGVQFHPEKSSRAGVSFVRDFVNGVIR